MGYRSDVYLAFHKSLLPFWLAHVKAEAQKELEECAVKFSFFEDNDEWCSMVFEDTKWYNSYFEVGAVENAFQYFCDHSDQILFQYLRVGEEFDDVEHLGWANKFRLRRVVSEV